MFRIAVNITMHFAVLISAVALCSPHAKMVEHLSLKYSEKTVGFGIDRSGGVVEVLSSPGGMTWTMILTKTNGISCIVAAGEYFELVIPKPPEEIL